MTASYKLVIYGDYQVGKSTYINRLKTGEFDSKSDGLPITLTFNTNHGIINFVCIKSIPDADAVIYLFDVNQKRTFTNLMESYDNFFCHLTKPVVYCGNKCDMKDRRVKPLTIKGWLYDSKEKYYEISAKTNYNLEKPFLFLARRLSNHEDLQFIESDPIAPVEVAIN